MSKNVEMIFDKVQKAPAPRSKPKEWIGRTHTRLQCSVPTKFWDSAADRYDDLNILNLSRGGFYFESEKRLARNTKIDIFVDDLSGAPELLKKGGQFKAWIKWTGKRPNNASYCAGAQIVGKSDSIAEPHARKLLCSCELCGQHNFSSKICKADDCIHLCRRCFELYPCLPEGIKKYLLGNIY